MITMTTRRIVLGALATLAFSAPLVATPAFAKDEVFVDAKGVAIHGQDPVSYFGGKGVPGKAQFASKYQGATYYFADAANKAKFDAKPVAYAPQYGGFCAYGASVERKFRTDPSTGTVVNGKLYFNKDPDIANTWSKDIPGNIKKADANWPQVKTRSIDG